MYVCMYAHFQLSPNLIIDDMHDGTVSLRRWQCRRYIGFRKVPEGRQLSKLEPEVEFRRQRAHFEFLFRLYVCPRSRYFHEIWWIYR